MASKESEAVRRHWESAREPRDQLERSQADHRWAELTAEPDDVDYLAVPGRPALWIAPHGAATDRVLLCLHGGGYISGSRYSHRKMFAHLAKAVGARALVIDYSLAPERIHPVQVDEAVDTYRWLLDQGIAPEHIVFTGDSAGGGMSITTQLRARAAGLPLPAGALPFSPWIDFEAGGSTYDSNRDKDAFFHRDLVRGLARIFLGPDGSARDPFVNPTYGDLTGLGPIYVQAGGDEVLLDDARVLAEAAEQAGVDVRLDVFPQMQHTFQMAAGRAPEADDAIARMGQWGRKVLGL
ncbi:alpha/beta hydrolase [Kribbella sp. NPDC059898]|uniref:alpha/beta hydrolase n=1 Tax=Kribbella sp. NPDC059898 TaxID=3346995 RepID=UPI00364C980B